MNILALTYWSYHEPLIQAATIPHLRAIRKSLPATSAIYLLTLEKPEIELKGEEKKRICELLRSEGIELITFPYFSFGIRAMFHWMANILFLRSLCRKNHVRCLHAFGTPIGSVAYVLHRITGIPFVIDSYEPHAEAMVENKSWKKSSLGYRLLLRMERLQSKHALAVLAATEGMRNYSAEHYGCIPAVFMVKPAGVDMKVFFPAKKLTTNKDIVCVYAGKIGGIYLDREVFMLFAAARAYWGNRFRVLLLSDVSPALLTKYCAETGLPREAIALIHAPHTEVAGYLRQADFALNPVKPVPSKRYCTSIKDGEYWASGLPIIIPPNISVDSDIIEKNKAGVIWKGFDYKSCLDAIEEMDKLLQEDRKILSTRIRGLAVTYRDFNLYENLYFRIYGPEGLCNQGQKHFLCLIYNSYKDPLFQNLMLGYLSSVVRSHPGYRVDLITYEQPAYALSPEEAKKECIALSAKGIFWHPLEHHSGSLILLKKLYDFLLAVRVLIRIRWQHKPRLIMSFANVAASIGILLSGILRIPHLVFSYEPHSEFLVDFGIWPKKSLKYIILSRLERAAGQRSDYVLTGTRFMAEELAKSGSKAHIFRTPSAVDDSVFRHIPEARQSIREQLHLENRVVIIYAGKFGGIYYEREIPMFFRALQDLSTSYYFIVLSPSKHEDIKELFRESGLRSENFTLDFAKDAAEVARWHSAADVGLAAIPPFPHQRYRSPVKVGEYLLCGLPIITCSGVSEDDEVATTRNVGAVIPDLLPVHALETHTRINALLNEDREALRNRCREAGVDYRGRKYVIDCFEKIMIEV
jgi:glycosyltransferase involved in cell wall biosynthesis